MARQSLRAGTSNLATEVVDAFRRRFGRDPEVCVRAPGRVNFLGAHVDDSGGWVLPGAIDRAVHLAAGSPAAKKATVVALDLEAEREIELERLAPVSGEAHWSDHPAGVAWSLRQAGHEPCGLDAVFASDVPIGCGVSSSAAVQVAFLLAWEALGSLELTPGEPGNVERARLCRRAENDFLGVRSGIMDPFVSLHGAADALVLLDCRTLEHRRVTLPLDAVVVLAHSGVERRLVDSGFNDRRGELAEAVEILGGHSPGVRTLRDVSRDAWQLHSHHLSPPLRRRSLHVVEEWERAPSGASALERGDLETFHQLVRASHLSSRDLYEVSIPELDVLAAAAWEVEGCWGARLAGGGFGGAVNALVATGAAPQLMRAMREAFVRELGREPELVTCRLGPGASCSHLA